MGLREYSIRGPRPAWRKARLWEEKTKTPSAASTRRTSPMTFKRRRETPHPARCWWRKQSRRSPAPGRQVAHVRPPHVHVAVMAANVIDHRRGVVETDIASRQRFQIGDRPAGSDSQIEDVAISKAGLISQQRHRFGAAQGLPAVVAVDARRMIDLPVNGELGELFPAVALGVTVLSRVFHALDGRSPAPSGVNVGRRRPTRQTRPPNFS